MNVAYKHLDSKLRIGELTIGQWAGVFAGVFGALIYGVYLSPFGSTATTVSATYLGGLPVMAVFLASYAEFDLWLLTRSAVRWRRLDARYAAGPGAQTPGYRITVPPEDRRQSQRERLAELDVAALWRDE